MCGFRDNFSSDRVGDKVEDSGKGKGLIQTQSGIEGWRHVIVPLWI